MTLIAFATLFAVAAAMVGWHARGIVIRHRRAARDLPSDWWDRRCHIESRTRF